MPRLFMQKEWGCREAASTQSDGFQISQDFDKCTQKNSRRCCLPICKGAVFPPASETKTVLTKKFMPYYRQKSTHCQMEEMGIDKIPVLPV